MDISNFSVDKLKAMAYDTLGSINNMQNNLNLLNQRIEQLRTVQVDPIRCPEDECECTESGTSTVVTPDPVSMDAAECCPGGK